MGVEAADTTQYESHHLIAKKNASSLGLGSDLRPSAPVTNRPGADMQDTCLLTAPRFRPDASAVDGAAGQCGGDHDKHGPRLECRSSNRSN